MPQDIMIYIGLIIFCIVCLIFWWVWFAKSGTLDLRQLRPVDSYPPMPKTKAPREEAPLTITFTLQDDGSPSDVYINNVLTPALKNALSDAYTPSKTEREKFLDALENMVIAIGELTYEHDDGTLRVGIIGDEECPDEVAEALNNANSIIRHYKALNTNDQS